MDKDTYYNFKMIFSCGTEYDFSMKGNQKILEIPNILDKDLKISIPENLPIVFSKMNILNFQNDSIQEMQFFVQEENNELFINIPLKGNISSYLETPEMFYNFDDDDPIPMVIKVEKKSAKTKNLINLNNHSAEAPKNASVTHNININNPKNIANIPMNNNLNLQDLNLNENEENDLNKLDELVEDIYFHPDKITKLTAKTNNITNKMLTEQKIILPILIDLEVDDFTHTPKASIDLICVVDKSGSMTGEPIDAVRKSLETVLDLLGEKDRLCLITFDSVADRITNLMQINKVNFFEFIFLKVGKKIFSIV